MYISLKKKKNFFQNSISNTSILENYAILSKITCFLNYLNI